jgi:hypothetical protein
VLVASTCNQGPRVNKGTHNITERVYHAIERESISYLFKEKRPGQITGISNNKDKGVDMAFHDLNMISAVWAKSYQISCNGGSVISVFQQMDLIFLHPNPSLIGMHSTANLRRILNNSCFSIFCHSMAMHIGYTNNDAY